MDSHIKHATCNFLTGIHWASEHALSFLWTRGRLKLLFNWQWRLYPSISFSFPRLILIIPSYNGHNIVLNFKIKHLAGYVEFCLYRAHLVCVGGSPCFRAQTGIPFITRSWIWPRTQNTSWLLCNKVKCYSLAYGQYHRESPRSQPDLLILSSRLLTHKCIKQCYKIEWHSLF